jgi:MFS family permease
MTTSQSSPAQLGAEVAVRASEWRSFWTLPVAAGFGYSTSVLHTYSLGAFFGPLQKAFGWSRAQIAVGITIAGVIAAIFAVPIGATVDKIGPRRIGLIGVLLMTASIALLGTATGSAGNWIFLWCMVAFANLWLQTTVWTSAVATRFERSRGLAFAVTLSGASFAATVFPILATSLIRAYGWRVGFMGLAGTWAVLVFPVLFLSFRGARDGGLPRVAASPVAARVLEGMTPQEGFRTAAFYQLVSASGLFTFTAIGIIVHFVAILRDAGTDLQTAGSIASLVGIFSIIGRVSTGLLLDRFSGKIIGGCVFVLPIIACALLYSGNASSFSYSVAAAIFGLTLGAEVDVISFLIAQHFGLKHYGVFSGAMVAALALGAAFGPLAAGAAFDAYGTYKQFLIVTGVCMALSSLAMATLTKPRFVTKH